MDVTFTTGCKGVLDPYVGADDTVAWTVFSIALFNAGVGADEWLESDALKKVCVTANVAAWYCE